jgi:hypothetical protein
MEHDKMGKYKKSCMQQQRFHNMTSDRTVIVLNKEIM